MSNLRHRKEKFIETASWVVMVLLLIKYVPRNRLREANIAFLFKQVITWLFGLMVTEYRLIKYPYRMFFRKFTKSSFTFEYFVYPALCVLFNLYYPDKKNYLYKAFHYFWHTGIITLLELYALKYTRLIVYKRWTWYWTFVTVWISYYISRVYYKWFTRVG